LLFPLFLRHPRVALTWVTFHPGIQSLSQSSVHDPASQFQVGRSFVRSTAVFVHSARECRRLPPFPVIPDSVQCGALSALSFSVASSFSSLGSFSLFWTCVRKYRRFSPPSPFVVQTISSFSRFAPPLTLQMGGGWGQSPPGGPPTFSRCLIGSFFTRLSLIAPFKFSPP